MFRVGRSLAGLLLVAAGTAALAGEPSYEELRQEVQQLKARLDRVEQKGDQSQKEMAAVIDKVLRDAEHRSQLLVTSGDTSAGYDNGFYIRSGAFVLKPGGSFQFRNTTDYRQSTAGAKSDETDNGFEVRRLQFTLEGTAFTQDFEYYFQWTTRKDSATTDIRDESGAVVGKGDLKNQGSLYLEDAWVKYRFADQWGVRAGQFKDPVTHEKLVSDRRVLTADRSLLDATLGGGYEERVQGVTVIYGGYSAANPLNIEVGLTDGLGSWNTNYTKSSFDFGIAGRAEYKLMGNWVDYRDFTALGDKQDLLVVGAGGDWSQGGDGNAIVGSVDVQYENTMGLGAYAAGIVRYRDRELLGADDAQTDYGLLAQVSYLITRQLELFGRYDIIWFDQSMAAAGGESTFHEITVGTNYYLSGHRAKLTLDVNFLPHGAPGSFTGLGYQGDSSGDNEIVVRGQFQLLL